jgi:hypothetical protein
MNRIYTWGMNTDVFFTSRLKKNKKTGTSKHKPN